MADVRVSGISVQVAQVSPSDLKVSGISVQVAYSTQELAFAGVEAQAYTVEPSQVQTAGLEVQAWVSTAQIVRHPVYFRVHRYYKPAMYRVTESGANNRITEDGSRRIVES